MLKVVTSPDGTYKYI
jgi:hypothetical protein